MSPLLEQLEVTDASGNVNSVPGTVDSFGLVTRFQLVPLPGAFTFTTSDPPLFNPPASNQGWWSATLPNASLNDSYFVGRSGADVLNDYFTFHLGAFTMPPPQKILAAVLNITRGSGMGNGMQTLKFFDVSTASHVLNNKDTSPNAAIFSDLGSGVTYGTFPVTNSGPPTEVLSFALNAAALTDIAAHAGLAGLAGDCSVGGSLDLTGLSE